MTNPPPRGTTPISELHRATAWRLLRQVILPRHRTRLMKNPDVLGVAVGVLQQAGKVDPDGTPALVVTVRNKGNPSPGAELPQWVTVTDEKHGRVAARIDVTQGGTIELQAQTATSPLVKAGNKTGSVFVRAQFANFDLMLTAGHVLRSRAHNSGVTLAKGTMTGRGGFHRALLYPPHYDGEAERPGLVDAAAVVLKDVGPLGNAQAFPWGDKVLSWDGAPLRRKVTICGTHGLVEAEWIGSLPTDHGDLLISGLPYFRCLLYRFKDPANITDGGDSGAAVLSQDGMLVGIHLGVYTDPATGAKSSLCHAAGDVREAFTHALGSSFSFYTGPA